MAQIQAKISPQDHQATPVGSQRPGNVNIREHLRRWEDQLPVNESDTVTLYDLADRGDRVGAHNILTRPQDGDRLSDVSDYEGRGDRDMMITTESEDQVPDYDESLPFLQQGDMVELLSGSQAPKHPQFQANNVQRRFRTHPCDFYSQPRNTVSVLHHVR